MARLSLIALVLILSVSAISAAAYTIYSVQSPAAVAGAKNFTIVVLPDTQIYAQQYPEIFTNQTEWIAGRMNELNIVFVAYEGDIVNGNSEAEWRRANSSLSVLDGKVPYGMAPGNHDKPTVLFNEYFPVSRYAGYTWYGGNYSQNDNSYQLFSAGGVDYIVVNLEFCPANGAISWANSVLQKESGRKAIIVTHGYMNTDGQRDVHICGGTGYIWSDLVVPNPNVFLVLSGHIHGEAMRSDRIGERAVYQLLADYQGEGRGGDGWLRILEFSPGEKMIYVRTYSPYLDQYRTGPKSRFEMPI
jgi:calcineurin-like phosphoesterase family protein